MVDLYEVHWNKPAYDDELCFLNYSLFLQIIPIRNNTFGRYSFASSHSKEFDIMLLLQERTTRKVISLSIDLISYEDALNKILELGRNRKPSYVCFANVHMTIEAYESEEFSKQVNDASLVLPDGVPLVKTLKLFYGIAQDRISGMDVMPDLIRLSAERQLKILFFGTTPELLRLIKVKVEEKFPNAMIVGLISPPFDRPLDDELYIEMINYSGANMVFVALGCPKQEKWIATHSHLINAVLLGVGGAFPVFAGVASRAPLFMQKSGLEWLYRLFQEPRRLFKRYFKTNTLFLYLVVKNKMKLFLNK